MASQETPCFYQYQAEGTEEAAGDMDMAAVVVMMIVVSSTNHSSIKVKLIAAEAVAILRRKA
jgi:hypothetical protein